MYRVRIKFEQKGIEPVILSKIESGQSLLELILNTKIDLHHQCGGICACTTCHLYIEKGMEFIEEINYRERDYLKRAVNPTLNSRLSCQCLLLDGKGEIDVMIPDQELYE